MAKLINFKRTESFKYDGQFFYIQVDKNDSICDIKRSEVTSWKEIEKGKRKIRIPETTELKPEPELLNKVKGNPYKIGVNRLITALDKRAFNIS